MRRLRIEETSTEGGDDAVEETMIREGRSTLGREVRRDLDEGYGGESSEGRGPDLSLERHDVLFRYIRISSTKEVVKRLEGRVQ
jgi:hypothetical protein